MAERKFQDLTIKNNFMFGAVMAEPKNAGSHRAGTGNRG